MAKIYDKVITSPASGFDRTLILDPREALVYPSPYDDWTVLHVGFIVSATNVTGDNADLSIDYPNHDDGASINAVSNRDRFYFGIKTNDSSFPGQQNLPFVGICSASGQSDFRNVYNGFSAPNFAIENSSSSKFSVGVAHSNGTFETTQSTTPFYTPNPSQMAATSLYGMFHGLTFTLNNKGLSNQSINIKYRTNAVAANGDGTSKQTDAQLKNLMLTLGSTDFGTFSYNNSGSPYVIPNSIFMYLPFPQIRLRIHHLGVIKQE